MFTKNTPRPRRVFYVEDEDQQLNLSGTVSQVTDAAPDRDVIAELHAVVAEVTGRPVVKRRIGF